MRRHPIRQVGDVLFRGEELLCDFTIELEAVFFDSDEAGKEPVGARFTISPSGLASFTWEAAVEDIRAAVLLKMHPLLEVSSTRALTNLLKEIVKSYCKKRLQTAPSLDFLLNNIVERDEVTPHELSKDAKFGVWFPRSGFQRWGEGKVAYIAGDRVLGDAPDACWIHPAVSYLHLNDNGEITKKVLADLFNMLNQAPEQMIPTWAFTLMTSVQSAILEAGVKLQAALYIEGPSGYGKSVLTERLCCLYDEKDGVIANFFDLSSTSPALLELMSIRRDMVLAADDLCRSSSKAEEKRRAEMAAKLVRAGANKVGRVKMDGKGYVSQASASGLVVTAEFSSQGESELNRSVSVLLTEELRCGTDADRMVASTALGRFLDWFAHHYDAEIADLREKYAAFKTDSSRIRENERLQTSLFSMCWVWERFLEFAVIEDALTAETSEQAKDLFAKIAADIFKRQNNRASAERARIRKASIARHLCDGLTAGAFSLAEESRKIEKSDGFIEENQLFLFPDAALNFIRRQDGYQELTKTSLSKALDKRGLLHTQESGSNTVKVRGVEGRMLQINLDRLKEETAHDHI